MAFQILRPIRNVYIALHKDTDAAPTSFSATTSAREQILFSPTSYPLCNVPGHHPDSTTHTHDDSASTTLACATPHNNAALASTSSANPDPPSSSVPASCCVDESLTDVSPLDNFHPAHQTTIEGLHIPITSPEPATAGAKRDIVTSGRTIPRPTPKTSISAPPLSSTSPPAAVSLQHNAGALTPSDLPNFRSSTSSHPVLDDKLPKGPSLSSQPPITRSDISPSCPDSRRSIVATTSLSAYLGPTSAPDPGAAAEDDGSPDPGLRKEADTLGPHSANRAVHPNTFVTLDLPPQSPSLPLVTESGVAVASASFKEPNAERTGYHPPDPLHGMHEIV
ncbi:hypothetical protein BJY52DRAFT_1216610 [Lactarius psammicola]|nr:hypothetical protein BJY52DRAFT_1216610 [Lactarius psammicola]